MYQVLILDTKTGERRTVTVGTDFDRSTEFLWTEGNYSDDGNRALFFFGWNIPPHEQEIRTNTDPDTERFIAIHAILPDGSIEELDGEP